MSDKEHYRALHKTDDKTINNLDTMATTLTWMGFLTLFGSAILLAKHFDRANKELDDTFDESVTAFNQDWE